MQAYSFLYLKFLKNRMRKIFRKPATVIYLLIMIIYFGWLLVMLNNWMTQGGVLYGTRQNMARILCVLALYLTPANYASYAKRKGLIFLPGDVHFLFSSPAGPKSNLMYSYGKTLSASLIMGLLMVPAGVHWFHVPISRMILYFLVCVVLDSVLEGALVILLYGNERLSKGMNRLFSWIMYGLIGCFVVIGVWILYSQGFQWSALMKFFDGEWISLIPVLGWNLAVMRLIILGPTVLNVICTVLYAVTFVVLVYMAWKMKCTGQYYEEATKFADDYQEARKKSKEGSVAFVGHKKKYRKVEMVYKGSGARAIFYRQLLEYKKERFFIFGFATLLYFALGIGVVWLGSRSSSLFAGVGKYYVVPGVMLYISFVLSGYKTRWNKELENPYVYLIPESPFQKMWYATLIDHIRSAVHGLLLAFPVVAGLRFAWWYLPIYILMLICINAVCLYSGTVCDVIFGDSIGPNLKKGLHMILFMAAMLLGIAEAWVVTMVAGVVVGMLAVSAYLAVLAGLMAWAGSRCFSKMES